MRLSIIGCPEKERFRPYVKRAVHFYAKNLMSEKMLENISIKITFRKGMDVYGYATVAERNDSGRAREFEIEINPVIGAHDILDTLAHEMVHVKQFAYSETNDSLTRWMGENVPEEMDYYDEPWEIEAYGMSKGLLTKFAKEEKLWEIFEDFNNPDSPIDVEPIKWKYYPTVL
jgi:hypothetical protein